MADTAKTILDILAKIRSTPVFVDNDDITYDDDHTINFDTAGTDAESVGDVYIFQYTRDHSGGNDELEISVNGATARRIKIQTIAGSLRDMIVSDIVRYNLYIIYRAGSFWHYIGGTRVEPTPPFDLYEDVTTQVSPSLQDRMVVASALASGNPNQYMLLSALKTLIGFNLANDITTALTTLADDDIFLIADESDSNAMKRVTYERLAELFRPSAAKDGTIIIQDPSVYNYRGDDITVQAVGGQAWVTINPNVKEVSSEPDASSLGDREVIIQRNSDNFAQKAYIKSNRKSPFFTVTPADLGDGHIGYAASGYDSLGKGFSVNAGGSSGYSGLAVISEQFRNFASGDFERVGSYTLTNTIDGLAGYNGNLYYLYDGVTSEFRGINPETGGQILAVNVASGSLWAGLTILNGIAYYYNNTQDRFVQYDIDAGTGGYITAGSGINLDVRGMAHANGNLYIIYVTGTQAYIRQYNPSDNTLGTEYRLTGFESDDNEQYIQGFTSANDTLYVSTVDTSVSNPHLYEVDPSNGNLTTAGDISPSNATLDHLAQLGDYIYAFNDDDNGIYRAEAAVGNRWVAIFPNSTTEVDDTDKRLRFFKERSADEIEMIRRENITDAIVFSSGYDDESANTIAVGTNETPALYKQDGTQIYEGSNEAIINEIPIGKSTVTTRGQLIATSSELPTAAEAFVFDDVTWTVRDDAPDGFESGTGNDTEYLYTPNKKPNLQVDGLEAVAFLNGIEVDSVNIPWGPGSIRQESTIDRSEHSLTFGGGNLQIDVYYEQRFSTEGITPRLYLYGDSDVLPSGCTVGIYLSGLFFEIETVLRIGV